ncbi:MAG: 1,4-dihydroxy-2-naphthoate polyprenyltransferase [Bacteroidaceae bacterium]|jgi:1,4-dihydroxy-2-naphthoate octaprenyltransferase
MNESNVTPHSLRAWLLAARPKTLPASAAPVLIGLALAAADRGLSLTPAPAIACLLFALLMQIASNFINDLYDYLKGSDDSGRLGPKRACAEGWISPRAMQIGIVLTVALACVAGFVALAYSGWPLLAVGAACVVGAYFYTTGPYPLSYNGWGDAMVVVFFGVVPVCATYWVQAGHVSGDALLASVLCGVVVDTLLVLNNYRDCAQDRAHGKRTLIVRFGERFGLYFYLVLGLSACWFCLVFAVSGYLWAAVLPQIYLVLHIRSWRQMVRIRRGRALNAVLGQTGRNIFFFALLLSAGFLLSAL